MSLEAGWANRAKQPVVAPKVGKMPGPLLGARKVGFCQPTQSESGLFDHLYPYPEIHAVCRLRFEAANPDDHADSGGTRPWTTAFAITDPKSGILLQDPLPEYALRGPL
jgi:hypothetical protein